MNPKVTKVRPTTKTIQTHTVNYVIDLHKTYKRKYIGRNTFLYFIEFSKENLPYFLLINCDF